jgi:hypothetical protein
VGRYGFVGSVVVALHVALGAWLLTTSGKTDSLPSVLPPLEVLPVIQAAPTRESLAGVSVQLSPVSIDPTPVPSPTLPRLSAIEAAPPEMAISISFATDVVITAANADDGATVARRCATREASRRAAPLSFQDMSILIRVETDGRVSDSRIETSSGDARADADAERCLRVYGAFHPARSQGQPIASWQRLRWVAGGLDRSS